MAKIRAIRPFVLSSWLATLRVVPAHSPPFEVPILYTATIGRTPENTVCLNFSPTVSRQHAIIRCHNGYEYQIMDLGSRNGTYVDDKRVVMPVTLQSGCTDPHRQQ